MLPIDIPNHFSIFFAFVVGLTLTLEAAEPDTNKVRFPASGLGHKQPFPIRSTIQILPIAPNIMTFPSIGNVTYFFVVFLRINTYYRACK